MLLFAKTLRASTKIRILRFNFKQPFQCGLDSNQVKYAQNIVSLPRRFLYTRPNGLMFKQHPWDQAKVNE